MIELFSRKNKENMMNLPDRQTMALAAMLFASILPVSGQPAPTSASSTIRTAAGDINTARIAGQEENFAASQTTETASMSQLPAVEIPAIDNLLNASTGFALPESMANHLEVIDSQAVSSVNAREITDAAGTASMPDQLQAVAKAATQSSEYIDTLYPDPLSPNFPTSAAGLDKSERNKTAEEMIEEFNIRAAEIAAETAEQLDMPLASMSGIATIISSAAVMPPAANVIPLASMPTGTAASAAPDLVTTLPEKASLASESSGLSQPSPYPTASEVSSLVDSAKSQTSLQDLKIEKPASVPAGPSENSKPAPEKADNVSQPISENEISETPAVIPANEQTVPAGPSADFQNTPANIEEIVPVSWPETDQDPEFASATAQPGNGKGSESVRLYEKSDPLEPALMTMGKPADVEDDPTKVLKISGMLVPEKHPVGRRRQLDRWVLKTDDGQRIPLKSNLKLLTEVRRENLLDGRVVLSGHYIRSGLNESLRYFAVESAVSAGKEDASGSVDIGRIASASVELNK